MERKRNEDDRLAHGCVACIRRHRSHRTRAALILIDDVGGIAVVVNIGHVRVVDLRVADVDVSEVALADAIRGPVDFTWPQWEPSDPGRGSAG